MACLVERARMTCLVAQERLRARQRAVRRRNALALLLLLALAAGLGAGIAGALDRPANNWPAPSAWQP